MENTDSDIVFNSPDWSSDNRGGLAQVPTTDRQTPPPTKE